MLLLLCLSIHLFIQGSFECIPGQCLHGGNCSVLARCSCPSSTAGSLCQVGPYSFGFCFVFFRFLFFFSVPSHFFSDFSLLLQYLSRVRLLYIYACLCISVSIVECPQHCISCTDGLLVYHASPHSSYYQIHVIILVLGSFVCLFVHALLFLL